MESGEWREERREYEGRPQRRGDAENDAETNERGEKSEGSVFVSPTGRADGYTSGEHWARRGEWMASVDTGGQGRGGPLIVGRERELATLGALGVGPNRNQRG